MVKSRTRGVSRIVAVGVLVLAAIGLSCGFLIVRAGIAERRSARQRLVRLLCDTDYETLLEACRDLSTRGLDGQLNPGTYGIRINPSPKAPHFPRVILRVEPAFVRIMDDGRVFIDMLGFPSYGVVAFPKGFEMGSHHSGDVELIPGLWYYDEDYGKYADRKKDIDSLVKRGQTHMEGEQ